MKDEGLEYLISLLPAGPCKKCALHLFAPALKFVVERDTEFGTAQLQRFLKTGYSQVIKVIDAMIALCVIEVTEEKPPKYRRLCDKSEIERCVWRSGASENEVLVCDSKASR